MRRRFILGAATLFLVVALGASAATAFGGSSPYQPDPERRFNLAALSNAFTFQGALDDGGSPAAGAYDFRFILYDDGVAGSQVGPVATVNDLAVSGGIFTTQLDFGAAAFDGAARWVEVQVRAGASSGSYTVLSPRQPVTATPYALYAKNIPLAGNGSSTSASHSDHGHFGQIFTGSATTGLQINSTAASGNGIVVNMDATTGVGLFASMDAGSGNTSSVQGYNTSPAGTAGSFITGSASGTALEGVGAGAGSTALKIENGAIKVAGAVRPAFEHEAIGSSIAGDLAATTITNPATDGNPTAILIVTPVFGVSNPHPVGVYYDGSKWRIRNSDSAPMALNARFNVLVINR